MVREEKADKQPETAIATGDGASDVKKTGKIPDKGSRSRSRRRAVSYDESTAEKDGDLEAFTSSTDLLRRRNEQTQSTESGDRTTDSFDPSFSTLVHSPKSITFSNISQREESPQSQPETMDSVIVNGASQNRPAADGKLFPFKLGKKLGDEGVNASTVTLKSYPGVVSPKGTEKGNQLGEAAGEMTNGTHDSNRGAVGGAQSDLRRPDIERFETAREEP